MRGVAPPYPGAFFDLQGKRIKILGTRHSLEKRMALGHPVDTGVPGTIVLGGRLHAICGDGALLELLHVEIAGEAVNADRFYALFGVQSHAQKIPFEPT